MSEAESKMSEQEAGPALDAEIARMVFKHETIASGGFERIRITGPHAVQAELIPPYSTDIGAAWLLVERMQGQGWWWVISTPFSSQPEKPAWMYTHEASVGRQGTTMSFSPFYRIEADTAPLAICRAALRAAAPACPVTGTGPGRVG